MLQTLSAIITILNFIYAALTLPVLSAIDVPTQIQISPSLAFLLFFFLELLCSYFICNSLIWLTEARPGHIRSFSLVFGILNAGTTLFNYQFLFGAKTFDNSFDTLVFCAFIFGAFIIDMIVITDLSRGLVRGTSYKVFDFSRAERNEFVRMQFAVYFLASLYLISVTRSL